MHVYIYLCTCVCTYMYIYIHTYTYKFVHLTTYTDFGHHYAPFIFHVCFWPFSEILDSKSNCIFNILFQITFSCNCWVPLYMCVSIYACRYIHEFVSVCIHEFVSVCIHTYMYIYLHTYTFMRICKYIRNYIYL